MKVIILLIIIIVIISIILVIIMIRLILMRSKTRNNKNYYVSNQECTARVFLSIKSELKQKKENFVGYQLLIVKRHC